MFFPFWKVDLQQGATASYGSSFPKLSSLETGLWLEVVEGKETIYFELW
jgi:hypothetical protein